MADVSISGRTTTHATRRPRKLNWTKTFLAALAETSNVSAAARLAGASTAQVYEARRTDSDFAKQWRRALCEGYDLLEIELLQRLRSGIDAEGEDGKRAKRAFDNATALRLLAAHRDTVARERAVREEENADAILASLNTKLERMRQQWLAAGRATEGEDAQ
jgi:hypothetical protein